MLLQSNGSFEDTHPWQRPPSVTIFDSDGDYASAPFETVTRFKSELTSDLREPTPLRVRPPSLQD